MHDELIERLRTHAKSYEEMFGEGESSVMLREASDAIEERDRYALTLQHEMMAEAESHIALVERLNKRIEELELHYCRHAIHNEHDRGDDSLCEKYKCEVTALPRWISVTVGLPEDGSDVLAYLKYDEVAGRITAANYDKGMWQDCVMASLYRTEEGVVTHWMPLPKPPKEEA